VNIRGKHYITNPEELKAYASELLNVNIPEHGLIAEIRFGVRTTKQNNAMHKYFTMLADTLNDAGLDQRKVMKPSFFLSWSLSSVKKNLWGQIMEPLTGKTKTSELERNEVSEVYELLSRNLAEKFGVLVDFPSKDRL